MMLPGSRWQGWLAGLLLVSTGAVAQGDLLSPADEAPEANQPWSYFGDLLLRLDYVDGLPAGRDPLERLRGRLRLGTAYAPMPELQFGAAIELGQGSDANRDNRSNNDNERSDGGNLDQLWLRWQAGENTSVLLGKAPFPYELSPLVWDQDLRPAGASVDHSFALGDFSRLQLTVGGFAAQHLYDDDTRIAAVQAAWRWREGAPTNGAVILSYLDFSHLEQLTRQGLARTNRRIPAGGPLASDYELLDLQLVGRTTLRNWPLEARLDLVHNLGADDDANGARFSVVLGDRFERGGWEFGYAIQRSQRDAVMAAFSEDDWWFHSFAHGVMPWVGYGIAPHWSVRLAAFHEQRDGLREHTDRAALDVEARW
ncbi:putative porin [Tahibacter amnicola]|uniref:Porin n=1 Tax=Tahibacter amnicola TaxID=2976241 RepID=A0ABY6B9X5_9GAMM|nr:putative porin [Tahibacter amnicola]UXI66660.1 putative porin [Tahibacter amnicola]